MRWLTEHDVNEEVPNEYRISCDRGGDRARSAGQSGAVRRRLSGCHLRTGGGDYHHSEQNGGCKSFGIWPLSQAAEACFGTPQWPTERPVPQVSIEFDVGDAGAVASASRELERAGYQMLHPPREEPWGQTVARLQSPEGAVLGISYTPVLHDHD